MVHWKVPDVTASVTPVEVHDRIFARVGQQPRVRELTTRAFRVGHCAVPSGRLLFSSQIRRGTSYRCELHRLCHVPLWANLLSRRDRPGQPDLRLAPTRLSVGFSPNSGDVLVPAARPSTGGRRVVRTHGRRSRLSGSCRAGPDRWEASAQSGSCSAYSSIQSTISSQDRHGPCCRWRTELVSTDRRRSRCAPVAVEARLRDHRVAGAEVQCRTSRSVLASGHVPPVPPEHSSTSGRAAPTEGHGTA